MSENLVTVAYICAGVLFILSLAGLSSPETARRGNLFGIVGMLIALIATALSIEPKGYLPLIGALIPAAVIGAFVASRVKMTEMPQLVALLHSFVGAAAVLVGFSTYMDPAEGYESLSHGEHVIHTIEIFIGVCIGSITFTGSIIACGKLHGKISGRPIMLPGRHYLNLVMLIATIVLGVVFARADVISDGVLWLTIATVITGIIGVHLIVAIGGADMPVVVSMLNSYSGWAAAAAGFMLANDLLIITGALVGSSGAILSIIMCRGMNRSFISVILGGFGTGDGGGGASPVAREQGDVVEISAGETAAKLKAAKKVIIEPGYGMAVAQAQHSLADVTKMLRKGGVDISFAIHPVAGRLPGHMNVLLAEANVPYDIVHEMSDVNKEFPQTDVVLVIGANDIVNPDALDDPNSPIAGMPVLHVWESTLVVVMKRSMASGYAGIANPLFFRDNTCMLFGDAKKAVEDIRAAMG